MNIPFVDLKAQYLDMKDEIDDAIKAVIDKTAFAGGPFVAKFEEEFADYCTQKYAVACSSGTDALELALRAAGIGEGDEVITVSHTFMATAEAISLCGATPVFIDVNEKDYTMNPHLIEERINNRTRAIIPVHLYGQCADMDPILEIADRHELLVIEDACQAHGALYKGRRAGSMGDLGCFSFYPGKNLGAYGEGGAVITAHKEWDDTMRMIRDHGQNQKYYHRVIGRNGRMDGLQGAILSAKLKHLDDWNSMRRERASLYTTLFQGHPLITAPFSRMENTPVFHLYVVQTAERDDLIEWMKHEGVGCGIHYPVPLHKQEAYWDLREKNWNLPVTESCSKRIISLPLYAEISPMEVEYVADRLIAFTEKGHKMAG